MAAVSVPACTAHISEAHQPLIMVGMLLDHLVPFPHRDSPASRDCTCVHTCVCAIGVTSTLYVGGCRKVEMALIPVTPFLNWALKRLSHSALGPQITCSYHCHTRLSSHLFNQDAVLVPSGLPPRASVFVGHPQVTACWSELQPSCLRCQSGT